jgi:DNA-binding SARP family transcriptional activator
MAAQLSLRLFGGFLLRADARPRPLPVRKAQALLAYLAVRAGRAHPRDTLTDLLWSDAASKQARQSLRQILVRLRRTLAGAHRAALLAQGDTVTLNPAALEVDVAQFEKLVRRGTPDALQDAVALYHGPLLDGFRVDEAPFDEWLQTERARLHELAVDALRRVVARDERSGRLDEAVHAATRLVALDPLQEDVHRTLMRLHARQGRRAAALRQYQTCVAFLQKELGVEPEPDTKRLYLEILQRPVAQGRRAVRAGAVAPTRPARAAADSPLIGRDTEHAQLRQRLREAWRGRGHVVLVRGEPGIGKSRLVDELAAGAMASGARVIVGHAYESGQILPFRPWVDALRTGRVAAQIAEGGVGSGAIRHELARLFPELAGGGAPPAITAEGHLRLFETIDALVAELARQAPLLLVLEDLQWADDLSLRLLVFVTRHLADRSVLVVGTYREGEEPESLRRATAELATLAHVETLAVGGLSQAATAALVRALARVGHHAGALAEVIANVWSLSEGSPFVIVETMRALHDGRVPDAGVELPRRVREMIATRLGGMSAGAQELARVASVFTREFPFPILQRAAGLGRRETAEAIEELVRRRIFDAVGERFDFTHVRLRQAVYEALLAPRRQTLHLAVGEALETVFAGRLDEVYDNLTYHFSRADEPARALTYLVHLADKVARRHALAEAVTVLRDALPYTDRLSPRERDDRRLDVVYRLAHVLCLLARSAEARDLLAGESALIARLGDPALSAPYHFWTAHALSVLGEPEAAAASARRALEDAARAGDEITMGRANGVLARELYVLGRAREGIAHARQSTALLDRTDDQWWLAQGYHGLSLNLLHLGDCGPALEAAERGRDIGAALGDSRIHALATLMTGNIYTLILERDLALAACERAVELAVDPVARAAARGYFGKAHQELGDPARAIPLLEAALSQFLDLQGAGGYRVRQYDAVLLTVLGAAYLDTGDVDRAEDLVRRALEAATAGTYVVARGYAERTLGRIARVRGKASDADAHLARALAAFESIESRLQAERTRVELAAGLHERGDVEGAVDQLRQARRTFTTLKLPRWEERVDACAKDLGLDISVNTR